jgi:outer membrane cobalamin receptor
MKTWMSLLCLFCGLNGMVFGQKVTLSGSVRDARTGEPLVGVAVFLPEQQTGANTNAGGFYTFSVNAQEEAKVVFSYLGYDRQEKQIPLLTDAQLNVKLSATASQLKEVQVTATKDRERERLAAPEMGSITLSPSQMKNLPSLGGEVDIIKVAQLLPGVKRGGEGQTGFYVRGGTADQNLILLDDVPLYNVSHLFGFFSVFNNDALKEVTLLKGSFPAHYGGRLSSVLDIKTQDGNLEKISAEGGVGLLSFRITVQGPLQKNKATFLVSARRSYLDKVLGVAGLQIPYYFYDTNLKLTYKLSEKDRFSFSSYYGNDVLSEPKPGNSDNPDEAMNADFGFKLGNFSNVLRWNHQYSGKLFSTVSLMHTRFRYIVNGRFDKNSLFIGSYIEDLGLKVDYDYSLNPKNQVRYGVSLTNHHFRPNIVTTEGEISEVLKSQTGTKLSPQEFAAYAENEYKPVANLAFNYGLRVSGLVTSGKVYLGLEPRLAGSYQVSENSAFKAGYTRSFQYLHLVSNSSVLLPTDLWYPVTRNVKPQFSDQYSAGFSHLFPSRHTTVSLEGYYKKMHRLIEYREGAQLLLNNNYENELLSGSGEAWGGEVFIHKTQGRFNGWVGYSLSWATRQFDGLNNGKTFYAKYDRRHDISVALNYEISKRLSVSAVWVYATGQRFTGRLGQYLVPKPGYTGVDVLPIYTDRNALQFSPSHRLDLNLVLKNKPHKRWQSEWAFGAYNVYNQAQPYRVQVEPNGQGGYRYQQIGLFGFIPSVAYNFKF